MSRSYANAISVPEGGIWPSILALIIGFAYGCVGALQLLVGLGFIGVIVGFTDPVGGLLLIIVSAVFLTGVKPLLRDEQEGYAFIAVGYILAAVMFSLQVLVIVTNGLGWVLRFEDWLTWNIYNDMTPSFWMFVILMTATGFLRLLVYLKENILPNPKRVSSS